jgi:hypothetical protein
VVGQLLWLHELAGPAIAAVLGLGLGVAAGAALVLGREHAVQRAQARAAAPAIAIAAAGAEQAEGDFIVPPGFYPDPRSGNGRRWWDGEHWTEKLQPAGET